MRAFAHSHLSGCWTQSTRDCQAASVSNGHIWHVRYHGSFYTTTGIPTQHANIALMQEQTHRWVPDEGSSTACT